MNKYVKYLNNEVKRLSGVYFANGLTENNFYLLVEQSESGTFTTVINDNGVEETYCTVLFE